jgi:hypothetical protein
MVRLPAGAQTCTFEVSADDTPEHPISFGTGSVPFPLQCWTDSALAHFSGSAWYETEFTFAGAFGETAQTDKSKLILDLGTVGLAAEVWVNGQSVGSRAWRPFRFDISTAIRPGKNRLRVRLTNSNAGWLAQGDTLYAKGSWGLKFTTERDRLSAVHPNGLEGPVRILSVLTPHTEQAEGSK